MKFSESELAAIAAAKRKSRTAKLFRILLTLVILGGVALMFFGVVIAEQMVYLASAAVLLAVALPQFGSGPKYEELLEILESKANTQHTKT